MARITGAAAIALAIAGVIYGCAWLSPDAQMDRQLKSQLADRVEQAQDAVWSDRSTLLAGADNAIAAINGMVDGRPALAGTSAEVPSGLWTLVDLDETSDGLALTLTFADEVTRGGGWMEMSAEARVCFILAVSPDGSRVDTFPAACGEVVGIHLADHADPGFAPTPEVSLNDLDVRRTVTSADYHPLPCQCYSGGDCDCPGG